jgi:formylmethanofuran dehydrogenase subunit B
VSLDEAAAEAARLLGASAQPVITGLGADIDGVRRAVVLAQRVGGVIDHLHSASMFRDLDSLRETGVMMTTPGEARIRADVLLLVGDRIFDDWPDFSDRLLTRPARPEGTDVQRRVVVLAKGETPGPKGLQRHAATVVFGSGAAFASNLASLRTRAKGRAITKVLDLAPSDLDGIVDLLKGARFGVAIWSAPELEVLEIEMLNGLVRDLNESTRFSTLPLAAPDNGLGALSVCGWMTGFPMRTGFSSGAPIHDPWRFDAERLVKSGETDCVVWVSSFGARPPGWAQGSISIALCDREGRPEQTPKVTIEVGRPGVDYDAVLHSINSGTLVAVSATSASSGKSLSIAEALARIIDSLPDADAGIC